MRLTPITICLRALKGERSIHGRPLPTRAEAVAELRQLTGQDFGEDAAAWGAWLRANRSRRDAIRSGKPDESETPAGRTNGGP